MIKKAKNKIVTFLILLICALLIQNGTAKAAITTVSAGSLSLYTESTGNVPITVSGISSSGGLGGYNIEISFNPTVMNVLTVLGGTSPFNSITAVNIDNTAGKVFFNHIISELNGPTGSIIVAYLNVRAIGSVGSSSSLIFSSVELVDAQTGETIDCSVVSGTVTIIKSKSASSISLSLSKTEIKIDESVTILGTISPAHSASVSLTLRRPNGSEIYKTISSGGDGSYSYIFTPDMAGTWSVVSSWFGDSDYNGAQSSLKTFVVHKLNSTISVIVKQNITDDEVSIKIEGILTPPHVGMTIGLWYKGQEGEWIHLAETETNETGGFNYVWDTSLLIMKNYEVKASWEGDWDNNGTESLPVTFNIYRSSRLSIWLSNNSTSINGIIIVRGQIHPIFSYENITISIGSPNGTLSTRTVLTDATGNYKLKLQPGELGKWSIKASWPGYNNTLACESSIVDLTVTEVGSSISLQVNTPSITIGSNITFSGQFNPALNTSKVTLALTKPDSSLVILQSSSTAEEGFLIRYVPDQAGIWLAEASWDGNTDYAGALSTNVQFTVEKLPSTITLSLSPPIPKKGDIIRFEGTLSPSIPEASVKILMSNNDGKTWNIIISTQTTIGGEYSAIWRAEKIGTFMFKAVWDGDINYSICVSSVLSLAIQEEVINQKITLPNNNETQIIISTNSSVTSFNFESTNGMIKINVTGPSGTTGLINIFFLDALLDSYGKPIENLVIAVNRITISPNIVRISGGNIIMINYNHNATVSIYCLTYSLTITVKDYQEAPIAAANVTITGPINTNGFTNSSGMAIFSNIPKGNYTVQVYYGPKIGESQIEVTDNKTSDINTTFGQNNNEPVAEDQNLVKTLTYTIITTSVIFVLVSSSLFIDNRRKTVHRKKRRKKVTVAHILNHN